MRLALAAHGVTALFTLCGGHISPILTGAKARGIRIIDTRGEATAVFAADAVARLTGVPGVAAVTAGPGITNAVTALKNAQLAQSPGRPFGRRGADTAAGARCSAGHRSAPRCRAPCEALRPVRRVRDIGPAIEEAFADARDGVQGPAFVELPVDLLYAESIVRQWYGEASGKGRSISDSVLRYYINRHLERLFGESQTASAPQARTVDAPAVRSSSVRRRPLPCRALRARWPSSAARRSPREQTLSW